MVKKETTDQREIVAKLLHRLAETVGRSSVEDLDSLLTGKAALVISSGVHDGPQAKSSKKYAQKTFKELATIAAKLREMVSRLEGLTLLNEVELNRRELEDLARLMDLPVSHNDDAERLKQKIIEESIGARLNSQAIRGR